MSHMIYYCISAMVSVGLSTFLLWALVSIHEPEAKLLKLQFVPDVVDNETTTAFIQMEVINRNYFRGFRYTEGGYVELSYTTDTDWWFLGYTLTPVEVPDFKNTSLWSFNVEIPTWDEDWKGICSNLTRQAGGIYVSVYLSYWYKILMWTTETTYYQWLDAQVNLNNNLDLERPVDFNRTRDFSMALET